MRPRSLPVFWILCVSLALGCGGGSGGSSGTPAPQTANDPPSVAIDSPTADFSYLSADSQVTLSGTALDDQAVARVAWASSRGHSGDAAGTGAWSAAGIPLEPGDNTLTVTAHDAQGLTAQQTLVVTYNEHLLFHGEPEAEPFALVTLASTEVIFKTMILPDPNLIAGSVRLLRVDAAGSLLADLGVMFDDGDLNHGDDIKGDAVFSAKVVLKEPAAGEAYFRIEASTKEPSGDVEAFSQLFALSVVDPVSADDAAEDAAIQLEAQARFLDDLKTMSKEDALADVVAWLEGQPGVLSASITASGDLWIEFDSGLEIGRAHV